MWRWYLVGWDPGILRQDDMQHIDADKPNDTPVETCTLSSSWLDCWANFLILLWEYETTGFFFPQVDQDLLTKLQFNPYVGMLHKPTGPDSEPNCHALNVMSSWLCLVFVLPRGFLFCFVFLKSYPPLVSGDPPFPSDCQSGPDFLHLYPITSGVDI